MSQGPREDAHDLIPRVVLCQPVLVDDEDGESQDRPVFMSQDVPAQHLEALVAVASQIVRRFSCMTENTSWGSSMGSMVLTFFCGFEPVQWGPVGVLAQVGPNVSGLWDSILSSLADAGPRMLPAPAASASLANSQASKAERVLFILTRRRNHYAAREAQRRNMHAAV